MEMRNDTQNRVDISPLTYLIMGSLTHPNDECEGSKPSQALVEATNRRAYQRVEKAGLSLFPGELEAIRDSTFLWRIVPSVLIPMVIVTYSWFREKLPYFHEQMISEFWFESRYAIGMRDVALSIRKDEFGEVIRNYGDRIYYDIAFIAYLRNYYMLIRDSVLHGEVPHTGKPTVFLGDMNALKLRLEKPGTLILSEDGNSVNTVAVNPKNFVLACLCSCRGERIDPTFVEQRVVHMPTVKVEGDEIVPSSLHIMRFSEVNFHLALQEAISLCIEDKRFIGDLSLGHLFTYIANILPAVDMVGLPESLESELPYEKGETPFSFPLLTSVAT